MVPMQRFLALSSALILVACDLAPEFALPKTDVPAQFKEVDATDGLPVEDGNWKAYDTEALARFGQDEWWKLFGDVRLDALIDAGMKQSPTLAAAREKLIQARQQEDVAEANLWPDITANAGANRQRQSPANPNIPPGTAQKPYTLYRAGLGIDYGLDLFGRARNTLNAAEQRGEAQKALFSATRLTLQADIASNYFALLSLAEEEALLLRSTALRKETLALTRKRFEIGEVSDLDVARAEGELATTESDMLSIREQRAATEHLLATLTGKPPADFSLPACEMVAGNTARCGLLSSAPKVPSGLPSTLLERRPDIAAAARELAARNAQIGVAEAAFYPAVDLTASFGYESDSLSELFDWSSRTWLLGPVSGTFASLPLFTGGRNTANLLLSKSSYREQVATYRGTVLTAFREVEDALVSVRSAREHGLTNARAFEAGKRAYRIARLQYDNGYAGYLELIDAERSLIAAARGEVQARGQQYVSTVTLIRALGGGWGEVKEGASLMPASKAAPVKAASPKAAKAKVPEAKVKATPERLARPWDATQKATPAKTAPAAPAIAPKAQPPVVAPPASLPFRKRNPSRAVPGLDVVKTPESSPETTPAAPRDLDTENAPENTVLPFKRQGVR